ncbi:MAG: DUF3108 domain-containing protein [Bacteroidetes bacterium HGW-Bacteroidetes-3]|jgi:hypothetical protein|nr:MAG: DUF3108 domain-containing protein [Bacteroidetes bacterium HGW-Bacteroidetes-3]
MRNIIHIFILLIAFASIGQSVEKINGKSIEAVLKAKDSPQNYAFKGGEWLKFKMSYSNFLNAGFSTMEVRETTNNQKEAFHILGKGKSTGIVSLFFNVKDDYQTYMYKESLLPYRFIRKIDEGGYTKDEEILFNHDKNEATVKNYKHNTVDKHPIGNDIQDLLSSLYFLRNQNLTNLKVGDEIELKMFIDKEVTNFKLRFLGTEVVKTKFGKVKSLKFRPMVQAGRVFKEQESLTIWISDDENKIPLLIKASLAVGSLRADLDEFKGLAHPFNIIF